VASLPRKRFWILLSLTLGICLLFINGCYLITQGYHLAAYQTRARKVSRILEQTDDQSLASFLTLAQQIKRFAVDSLGLAADRNYTTFVQTDKTYLVDVVTACAPDTFKQRQWCYPIVGCVPYKGFFTPKGARRLSRRLEQKGYDIHGWQARAFSSLGLLTDPLLSYMRDYSVYELASLIIHEQTHATLYLKGEAQFNEELASFIGREGALRFIAATAGDSSAEYAAAVKRQRDYATFLETIDVLYGRLDSLYKCDKPRDSLLREKARIIDACQKRFSRSYTEHFETDLFRGFPQARVNNAYLSAYNTYNKDLDLYYRLYERNGRDLRGTIALLLQAEGAEGSAKEYLESLLEV
jgi:predicted aminopeptidase